MIKVVVVSLSCIFLGRFCGQHYEYFGPLFCPECLVITTCSNNYNYGGVSNMHAPVNSALTLRRHYWNSKEKIKSFFWAPKIPSQLCTTAFLIIHPH